MMTPRRRIEDENEDCAQEAGWALITVMFGTAVFILALRFLPICSHISG